MVIINRVIAGFENRCVDLDNQKGTFSATEMLIKLGHKHIGYIGSDHQISDENERVTGYLQALEQHHFPLTKSAIVQSSPDFEGGKKR